MTQHNDINFPQMNFINLTQFQNNFRIWTEYFKIYGKTKKLKLLKQF